MEELTTTQRLADTIRRLRRNLGWSARQLAEECSRIGAPSLTRSTLAKIESGNRKSVTAAEVAALAQALRVTPTDLLDVSASHATLTTSSAEAVARLIEALGDADDALIQMGSLILVKNKGVVTVREIGMKEAELLRERHDLLRDPALLLEWLQNASQSAPGVEDVETTPSQR